MKIIADEMPNEPDECLLADKRLKLENVYHCLAGLCGFNLKDEKSDNL